MSSCENCINFREFDDLDVIDNFTKIHFDGYCFSKNKEHGDGKVHIKGDWCNEFKRRCNWDKCKNHARWNINFNTPDEPKKYFCDIHFIGLRGCDNVLSFRFINYFDWIDFIENENILQDFVNKSYQIPEETKYKKIDEFL